MKQKIEILNTYIDNLSLDEAIAIIDSGVVVTPNIHHLVQLQNDSKLQEAYSNASFRLCDSQILYFILKILGEPIKAKLSGSDLFPMFIEKYSRKPLDTIFLFGNKQDNLDRAELLINTTYNRTLITGTFSPPYKDVFDSNEIKSFAEVVNKTEATILFISLTGGKQEKLAVQLSPLLAKVRLVLCFGAGMDFFIGAERRAPELISKLGLEWIWRISQLGMRILPRYFFDLKFFYYLIRWIYSRRSHVEKP